MGCFSVWYIFQLKRFIKVWPHTCPSVRFWTNSIIYMDLMALSIDAAKKLTTDSVLEGDEFRLFFEQILNVMSL